MKETLLGLTTLTVLFGLAWFSASDSVSKIEIAESKEIKKPPNNANNTDNYKGKVAAFGSWDVFPFIINEDRSGVPVNAGFELAKGEDLSEKEVLLNDMQPKTPSPWGSVRLDAFTHYYALEHMKKEHPNLVYVAYGETDDFAHDGEYDAYLKSANATDAMIQELWHYTQSDSFYKDKSFYTMRTDSLDRFGTRIEKRFSKKEIESMLLEAGFNKIKFSDKIPYWIAIGYKK